MYQVQLLDAGQQLEVQVPLVFWHRTRRKLKHFDGYSVRPFDLDDVAGPDLIRRFGRPAVDRDHAGLRQFLGHGSPLDDSNCGKKVVYSHKNVS